MRKDLVISAFILSVMILIGGCSQDTPSSEFSSTDSSLDSATSRSQHSQKETFHYQLQGAGYANLKDLYTDVMIIDIDDAGLEEQEISALKSTGKILLSYLSIGEAEDYRDYWQQDWKVGNPDFIDDENPDWRGNYKVKYWDPGWQVIIIDRVRTIAEQGYDGAYLDIIDAYEYYEEKGRASAADEMISLVRKIRQEARSINPEFMIIPQNSPELYSHEEYRDIIDGVGKEDTWYDDDREQDPEETRAVLKFLDMAAGDGKLVLAIDYPTEQDKICDFYVSCWKHGFRCAVSDRDLSRDSPLLCNRS